MSFVPVSKMEGISSLEKTRGIVDTKKSQKVNFKNILKDAIKESDESIKDTREMDLKLATGQIDNLHTALIQAEQAAATIEFTTQLTSKAVNAYNQIMGMQI